MAMGPAKPKPKDSCVGGGQQQFTRPAVAYGNSVFCIKTNSENEFLGVYTIHHRGVIGKKKNHSSVVLIEASCDFFAVCFGC
jgi:hypothetical protein